MIYGNHILKHNSHDELVSDNTLHVIGVISNPVRYQSRWRLFKQFAQEMEATKNVKFYIVEIAYGDRQFEMTQPNNPQHLQLRTSQEIWHKENMINLGVKHLLPNDWKYVAWVDGDVTFTNPGWALETIHQLQHYPVVQPWSHCVDLGPHGNVLQLFESFCSVHRKRLPKQRHPSEPYKYAHSGFAWACTRYFWENVGGLMDFPILGSADHHMAWCTIGDIASSVHGKMLPSFHRRAREWMEKACHVTHGDDVGYVSGRIEHHFHGPKNRRYYRERWQILIDNGFCPDKDLAYDSQGLLYIKNKPRLISDIRDYFRMRNEDSIEHY